MQSLQVDRRFTTLGAAIEHRGGTFQKLRLPLRDLIRMNVDPRRTSSLILPNVVFGRHTAFDGV
jgi:hypothetical protein